MTTTIRLAGRRATWLAALASASALSVARAQAPVGERPAAESGAAENTGGTPNPMLEAYRRSKTARTEADFVAIIEGLDAAISSGSLPDDKIEYARRLKGWAHNKRGELLAAQGRDEAALKQFEAAVKLNPEHWKARHNRGVSYAQVPGRQQDAIEDFSRTIELNRNYANAWFNRGELYFQQGDIEAAVRDYSEAIGRAPDEPTFYQVRGNAYHHLRRFDDALADYNHAIELAGQNPVSYVYRGDTYTVMGNYEQAAQDYRRAIQLNQRFARAYQSTAWLMATCPDERFRDPQRALLAARKALELSNKKSFEYLETLAAACAAAGQYEEAVTTQKQALEAAPQTIVEDSRQRLRLYQQQQPYRMRPRTALGKWGPASGAK